MKNGIFCINRRVVTFVVLLSVVFTALIPKQIVKADTFTKNGSVSVDQSVYNWVRNEMQFAASSDSPIYSFVFNDGNNCRYGLVSKSSISGTFHRYLDSELSDGQSVSSYSAFGLSYMYYLGNDCTSCICDIKFTPSSSETGDIYEQFSKAFNSWLTTGNVPSGMELDVGGSYKAKDYAQNVIGALQGVRIRTKATSDGGPVERLNKSYFGVTYDSTTTTGVDLSKGGYKVEVCASPAYQNSSKCYEDNSFKKQLLVFPAEDNIKNFNKKYHYFDQLEVTQDLAFSDSFKSPSLLDRLKNGLSKLPVYYARVISKDNKYGAWVRITHNTTSLVGEKTGVYNASVVDDSGNKVSEDDGGYSNSSVKNDIGGGTGMTDSEMEDSVDKAAEKNDRDEALGNGKNSVWDNLEDFLTGIGQVPRLVADLFSFLPSWCLNVCAIGFALMITIMVIKFIRG